MHIFDMGMMVFLGILAAAAAGILLRKLAPVALKLLVGIGFIFVLGLIAEAAEKFGVLPVLLTFAGVFGLLIFLTIYFPYGFRNRRKNESKSNDQSQ